MAFQQRGGDRTASKRELNTHNGRLRRRILFFVNKEKNQKKNFLRETVVSLMFEFVQFDVVYFRTTFPPLHTYV